MPFRYLIRKPKQQGENMRYEEKAEIQDGNKARIYEARMVEEKKKKEKGEIMKKYKLTDTSEQTIIYTCEVKANSEEEAIEKAKNWQQVDCILQNNTINSEILDE